MPVTAAVGIGTLAFSAYQYAKAQREKKKADAAFKKDMQNRPEYNTPQTLTDQLATARSGLNAQSPATAALYNQAQQNAANVQGFAQRNASSGAQAIQAAANAQAQTQTLLPQIAMQQEAFRQNNLSNYNQALSAGTEDARAKYEASLGRYSDLANYNLGLVGAASQDKSQALAAGITALGSLAGTGARLKKPFANTTTQMSSLNPVTKTAASYGFNTPQTLQPMGMQQQYNPLAAYYLNKPIQQYNPYAF